MGKLNSVQDIMASKDNYIEILESLKNDRLIKKTIIEINKEVIKGITNETGLEIQDFILNKLIHIVAKENSNVLKLVNGCTRIDTIKHNKRYYDIKYRIVNLYNESITLNVIKYEVR